MADAVRSDNCVVRALAFLLPQFHPTPDNDAFWGPGFTEWTNVTRARASFDGHHQPHLPADLGFYDLRLPDARVAQADLARAHGLHGFVYYHYWFHGRRLLERPVNEILASKSPDFPFCLCWANENWTRRWDGLESELLVEQVYSATDDLAHIRWLAHAFDDPRYIRVDGKPLFLVYRASRLPDPLATTGVWREEARRLGIGELYLGRVESFPSEKSHPQLLGFDAAVEFQPDWEHLGQPRLVGRNRVYDYADIVPRMLAKPPAAHRRFPGVTPSWDNTARRRAGESATILDGASPELYEQWLAWIASDFVPYSKDENFIFINAWNEWAEGNHLEPCQRWGRGYVEATQRALAHRTTIQPQLVSTVEALRLAAAGAPIVSAAPVRDTARETLLLELYGIASRAALEGDRTRAGVIFGVVSELAEPVSSSLAGKSYYKRSQLARTSREKRELLERCLTLYPEHLDARRQLTALSRRGRRRPR